MKIGIEAQRIMRKKKHGMDMVAINLLEWLPKVAPQHEYVLFTRRGEDEELLNRLKGIRIVYVNGLTYVDWEQIWLPKAITREGVDLMHYTGNTASLFCSVPYVLTLHDVIYLESTFSKSNSIYQQIGFYYRKFIVPHVAKNAASVITVSKYECEKIKRLIPAAQNVSFIYNAISENFGELKHSSTLAKKLPQQYMFFLGNTDPKKNTINVLKAYIRYRNKLNGKLDLVVGDFNQSILKNILKRHDAINLLPTITTLGYLSNHDLPTIYSKAACFLYPSLRESFGIPILEAMACGCPVVTSNTSSMPEVSGDAALFVDPTNFIDLSLAMLTMEFSTTERNRLSKLGKDQVNNYSWKKSALQYAHAFNDLQTLNFSSNPIAIKSIL